MWEVPPHSIPKFPLYFTIPQSTRALQPLTNNAADGRPGEQPGEGEKGLRAGWSLAASHNHHSHAFCQSLGRCVVEESGYWHRTAATTAKNFYLSSDCPIMST